MLAISSTHIGRFSLWPRYFPDAPLCDDPVALVLPAKSTASSQQYRKPLLKTLGLRLAAETDLKPTGGGFKRDQLDSLSVEPSAHVVHRLADCQFFERRTTIMRPSQTCFGPGTLR